MWTCPKCGREFKKTNQGHYCGKAPVSVDEYIEMQNPEARAHIEKLRNIIRSCVPDASERIAWSMPTYQKNGRSVGFAACQKHVSLYPDAGTLEELRSQLNGIEIRKNTIYLPYDRTLPSEVLEIIIKKSFESD